MPGSYRSINQLLKEPKMPKVKAEEEVALESSSSSEEENQDVLSTKWDLEQNLKFTIFVHYFQNVFASKRKRKLCKIFKAQAEYLERRTPTQCRSHFQKMMAKHKSIARLKKHYKSTMGNEVYTKEFHDFKKGWEENHQPLEALHPELRQTREISIQTDPAPQEQALCQSCRNGEENQQMSIPQQFPYQINQVNPFMLWLAANQQNFSTGSPMMWMPGNNPSQGPL